MLFFTAALSGLSPGGDPDVFPGQMRYVFLSESSWSTTVAWKPSRVHKTPKEDNQKTPNLAGMTPEPLQLPRFDKKEP